MDLGSSVCRSYGGPDGGSYKHVCALIFIILFCIRPIFRGSTSCTAIVNFVMLYRMGPLQATKSLGERDISLTHVYSL